MPRASPKKTRGRETAEPLFSELGGSIKRITLEIVLGSIVSLLIEYIKTQTNIKGWQTLGALFVVSLIAAACYTYLVAVGYWATVAQVLITAGAFYTFIVERFK